MGRCEADSYVCALFNVCAPLELHAIGTRHQFLPFLGVVIISASGARMATALLGLAGRVAVGVLQAAPSGTAMLPIAHEQLEAAAPPPVGQILNV